MANIHVDSELLLHHLPASAFNTAFQLQTVLDENKNPLLFAVGTDNKLRAFRRHQHGSFLPIDLSTKLGLKGNVDSFAVTQYGDVLFLVVSTSTPENGTSLSVLRPFKTSELLAEDVVLRGKLLKNRDNLSKLQIRTLHINTPNSKNWPLLTAVYHDTKGNYQGDAKVARISPLDTQWEWSNDLGIPQVSKGVLAISAARIAVGEGLAVLNKDVFKNVKLFFTSTDRDPNGRFQKEIKFPTGAEPCSITPLIMPSSGPGDGGESNFLLVGAGGLFLVTYEDFQNIDPPTARCISTHEMFKNASDLHISHSSGWDFSAWFKTSNGELAYQRASFGYVDEGIGCTLHGEPIPLLDSTAHVIDYVPILHPTLASQTLIVLNNEKKVTMMQHAVESGMWNNVPLLVKAPGDVSEVQAYVSHIQVTSAEGHGGGAAALAHYHLSASRPISALVNGSEFVLSKNPIVVQTNGRGVLTIVAPTDDLGVPTFTLSDASSPSTSSAHALGRAVSFDPSQKIFDRLKTMLQGESDIRKVKTEDGSLFLEGSSLSDHDARNVSKTISQLIEVHGELSNSLPQSTKSASDVFHSPPIVSIGSGGSSIKRAIWDFFTWVKKGIKSIADLVVKKLKDAWHFVCEIAGKTWAFILDTKEAVCKALSAIGNAIGEGAKWVWNKLKSLLDFDSIVATSKSIREMVTNGLDFAANQMASSRETVDAAFVKFEKNALDMLKLKLPPNLAQKREKASEEKAKAGAGVKESYGLYHFEQGAKDAQSKGAIGLVVEGFKAIWRDLLQPMLEDFWETFKAMAEIFVNAVKSGKGVSIADVFAEIGGTLLDAVIRFFKNLVTGVMKLTEDLLTGLNELLNAPLEIPVISWLLRKFGVEIPSVLEIISFVLAFMTVQTSRIVVGKAPDRIMKIDFESMLKDGKIDKGQKAACRDLVEFVTISASFLYTTYSSINIVLVAEPESFSLIGTVISGILAVVALPLDKDAPGQDERWAIYTANMVAFAAHIMVHKVPANFVGRKLVATLEVMVALASMILSQVVRAGEISYPESGVWKEKDNAVTGFRIGADVSLFVKQTATAVGIVVDEPITKAVAIVTTATAGMLEGYCKTEAASRLKAKAALTD